MRRTMTVDAERLFARRKTEDIDSSRGHGLVTELPCGPDRKGSERPVGLLAILLTAVRQFVRRGDFITVPNPAFISTARQCSLATGSWG